MLECFIPRNFSDGSLDIITHANQIIAEYQAQGFTLTLRQLYYQFVSRDLLKNTIREYKRLGSIINDARLAGVIDWEMIEDRTRNVQTISVWDDPAEILSSVGDQYKEDLWADQEHRVEVWIEKNALIGVIEPVCRRWRVPHLACIGYLSQSEQYAAGKRFAQIAKRGQTPVVLHLGDHDPSGIDMTRDNTDRLSMFAREGVDVRRLALNMSQIEQYRPPPNPAKETDSRHADYSAKYGDESWELDALEPTVIDNLIEREIRGLIDDDLWDEAKEKEDANGAALKSVADNWSKVQRFLTNNGFL